MDAGALHQLHNAGYEHAPPVADGVHLHLFAADIVVHQHRLILVDLHRGPEVGSQILFFRHDLHGAAPQHEAGAHEDRVADFTCGGDARLHACHGLALRLGDLQLQKQLFKLIPVLCPLDGGAVRSDKLHEPRVQRRGQIDGRLPAQSCDHALRLLQPDHVHHVLDVKRLEIELVGTGVIRGDRFRIVIDDDGFIARPADCLYRVDGGIVEFDALPDADGSRAQHHDLLFIGNDRLILFFVCGIEIGHVAFKFRSASVDHLIHRRDPILQAKITDRRLSHTPEPCHGGVRKAHALGVQQFSHIPYGGGQRYFFTNNIIQFLYEEPIDRRCRRDPVYPTPQTEELRQREHAVVRALPDVGQQLTFRHPVELAQMQMVGAGFQRADPFQ